MSLPCRRFVALLAELSVAGSAAAQTPPALASEGKGLPIGVRQDVIVDYSRTWRRGPGEHARRILVHLWYPAADQGRGPAKVADLYCGAAVVAEESARGACSFLRRRDSLAYRRTFDKDTLSSAFRRVWELPLRGALDAVPSRGRFPVVVYAAGWNSFSPDNIWLAERLASRGIVVIAVTQLPALEGQVELGLGANDLETQTRDVEAALGYVSELPFVDPTRIAIAGYSMGGVIALRVAQRHPVVRGVVGLDASFGVRTWIALTLRELDIRRVKIPVLLINSASADSRAAHSPVVVDSMHFADRYIVGVPEATHEDFSHVPWLLEAVSSAAQTRAPGSVLAGRARLITDIAEDFLTRLLEQPAGSPVMPSVANSAAAPLAIRHIAPLQRQPSDSLGHVLAQFGVDTAMALLARAVGGRQGIEILDEGETNARGYNALGRGDARTATRWFVLNVRAFPRSANGYDSLSDGAIALGDSAAARAAFRRVLALAPADLTLDPAARSNLERRAREQLRALASSRSSRAQDALALARLR